MQMRRRPAFLLSAICAVVAAIIIPASAQMTTRRPNVLLIMTDDQGYGDLGMHGNEKIQTPNLDRLGLESVRMHHFYVSPVCAPTRASLMTGRWNYRTGVVDTYLGRAMMRPEEVTLAETLSAEGYRTGIFGKWHLGDNYPMRAVDQGFQESLVLNGGGLAQPGDHPDSSPDPGMRYWDPLLMRNGRPEKTKGYCSDLFTDAAINFIRGSGDRPWFTYLPFNAPHTPLQVDDELVKPYRAMGLDETTARVYAMVDNIDSNVGRLMTLLDELKKDRETIVVFLTDNGPQQPRYNAGMRGRKGTVYEGGIRVPGFIRWRGALQPGLRSGYPTAHIDILPTLLAACGVERTAGPPLDGINLLPYLLNAAALPEERTLVLQWHRGDEPEPFRDSAVRNARYKLVGQDELYDLVADPTESENIASRQPEVAGRLRAAYRLWFDSVSSAGYPPSRIAVGAPQEDPVVLSRQDWRGPRAGWDAKSLGFWEVDVRRSGSYSAEVRLAPAPEAREVTLRAGASTAKATAPPGAASVRFEGLKLSGGPARIESWAAPPGADAASRVGVHHVILRPLREE